MANLGVPVKLLHESLGHIITVELKTGEVSSFLCFDCCSIMLSPLPDGVQLTLSRCTEES